MNNYYSKSTGGFYNDSIHASLPADAVAISADEYAALLDGQCQGKVIVGDSEGKPMLTERTLTADEQALLLQNRAKAALYKSDLTILRCYEAAISVPEAWATYRSALRAIVSGTSTATSLPDIPAYPEGT